MLCGHFENVIMRPKCRALFSGLFTRLYRFWWVCVWTAPESRPNTTKKTIPVARIGLLLIRLIGLLGRPKANCVCVKIELKIHFGFFVYKCSVSARSSIRSDGANVGPFKWIRHFRSVTKLPNERTNLPHRTVWADRRPGSAHGRWTGCWN